MLGKKGDWAKRGFLHKKKQVEDEPEWGKSRKRPKL